MNNNYLMLAIVAFAVFVLSCEAHGGGHHGGGGGGGSHHHGGGGGGGGHHHHGGGGHYHGGGGGFHHHHHSSYSGSSSDYSSNNYYGGGGGFGLGRLLFGGLFRRPSYSYYPSYYGYGNYNRGYCRVAQLIDYVGGTPRYYCDCPPYAPNYQWNQCTPMAVSYGKK